MTTILTLMAIILVVIGTIFSVIGVVGFHRLPDVYTRLHATGKVGVLGIVMLLLAAALVTPLSWGKTLLLILFLVVVGPVTTHVLSSAAYRLQIDMKDPHRNDLVEVNK